MSACPPAAADDGSDGNESLSAPSEFLAEFLSAIMRRQYAEALKYCRLILQYEPHNATARGFYPLLRHKLTKQPAPAAPEGEAELSASDHSPPSPLNVTSNNEAMEHSADVSGEQGGGSGSEYASSQSSLELDSEPDTDTRDRTDSTGSASGSRWDSSGSSPRDDNGNTHTGGCVDTSDVENDNAPHLDNEPATKPDRSEMESWASLRRLRARFAAIK